jgi:serine/threonine protein phosphatase PrpC
MGSDGIWEFISNEEAVKLVAHHLERGDAARAVDDLMEAATQRWRQQEDVIDDMTCMVAILDVQ